MSSLVIESLLTTKVSSSTKCFGKKCVADKASSKCPCLARSLHEFPNANVTDRPHCHLTGHYELYAAVHAFLLRRGNNFVALFSGRGICPMNCVATVIFPDVSHLFLQPQPERIDTLLPSNAALSGEVARKLQSRWLDVRAEATRCVSEHSDYDPSHVYTSTSCCNMCQQRSNRTSFWMASAQSLVVRTHARSVDVM